MKDRLTGTSRGRMPVAPRHARSAGALCVALALAGVAIALAASTAGAAVSSPHGETQERAAAAERGGSSLEAAASKAGSTGRAVAMSLIGLAFAVAATVLAFRRDFKEAAGVFAVGIVSVLLATPTGISLLRDTVDSLFGAQ
jgi:lysylphosphatidylglycerol synthetase-like protein (DUF2156 family)